MITLIHRAEQFKNRIAIRSQNQSYTYSQLLEVSNQYGAHFLNGASDLNEARVAFIVDPSFEYTALQWGIWRAGGIAVPLCVKHPLPSLEYVMDDTQASILVYSEEYKELVEPLTKREGVSSYSLEDLENPLSASLPEVALNRRAMILYTSGTTGKPKGVVTTHEQIQAQITALTTSWEWTQEDSILNVLPLHHVHGIINVMSCALWSGACNTFLSKFSPEKVFEWFTQGGINVFMAVPTIYFKLISYYESLGEEEQKSISNTLENFRLMVSGSAALPVSVLEKWKAISGHVLLERYGMTEMGMAISNSYREERKPGFIGNPLAGVNIRLADENDLEINEGPGEIQVQGKNVFHEYWQKPEATQETFTKDGWFKTGDIAVYEQGAYRILGRNSVDIIKSGGYKISALEIEEVLRTHPEIKECGVVGLPDEEWGEIIGASIISKSGNELDLEALNNWLKERIPAYKMPRNYIFQEDLPRNVMGKVTKNELKNYFN